MIFEYSDLGRIEEMYKNWIEFCRSLDCKIKFLDAETREFSEISESEALEKIQ